MFFIAFLWVHIITVTDKKSWYHDSCKTPKSACTIGCTFHKLRTWSIGMAEHIEKRVHKVAHVETYEVTSDELDTIEKGYSARQNDLQFLSLSAGIFVSFLLNLLTLLYDKPEPTLIGQFYFAMTAASGFACIYLTHRWQSTKTQDKPTFQRIRARAAGPLGDENKEIKRAELEDLPVAEPEQTTKDS